MSNFAVFKWKIKNAILSKRKNMSYVFLQLALPRVGIHRTQKIKKEKTVASTVQPEEEELSLSSEDFDED